VDGPIPTTTASDAAVAEEEEDDECLDVEVVALAFVATADRSFLDEEREMGVDAACQDG
jgi:hypothetical protein